MTLLIILAKDFHYTAKIVMAIKIDSMMEACKNSTQRITVNNNKHVEKIAELLEI